MVHKCANSWCPTAHREDEGKMFRLDIDLEDKFGGSERKTEYVWLCNSCAQLMHPKVVVSGNAIKLMLTKNDPTAQTRSLLRRAN